LIIRSSQKISAAKRRRIDLFYEEAAVHYFIEGTDLLLFKGKVLIDNQSLFFSVDIFTAAGRKPVYSKTT